MHFDIETYTIFLFECRFFLRLKVDVTSIMKRFTHHFNMSIHLEFIILKIVMYTKVIILFRKIIVFVNSFLTPHQFTKK